MKDEYPTVFVGIDKEIGDEPVVKVDGKFVGKARDVLEFVGRGIYEAELARAFPEPDWLKAIRGETARASVEKANESSVRYSVSINAATGAESAIAKSIEYLAGEVPTAPIKWLKVPDGTKNAAIYMFGNGRIAFVADQFVVASDRATRDAAKDAHRPYQA